MKMNLINKAIGILKNKEIMSFMNEKFC